MKKMNFEQMEVINGGQTVSAAGGDAILTDDGFLKLEISCFFVLPVSVASWMAGPVIGLMVQPIAIKDFIRCATT